MNDVASRHRLNDVNESFQHPADEIVVDHPLYAERTSPKGSQREPRSFGGSNRCDSAAIVRQVVEQLASIHGERFLLKAEDGALGIWSTDVLRRALWNLAANAIRYGAPEKPVTITIRRTDGGSQASVHNFGSVLSPEDQAHLFEPFERTRSARAGSTRGWASA